MALTIEELKDLIEGLAISQARREAEQAKREAEQAKRQAERDASWAALEKQIAKTDKKFKTMQNMLDGISRNQGSVAEAFFYNSLNAHPVLGDIVFDRVTPGLVIGRKGKESEYDVVLVNGASVGIVEVKYKAHLNDLEQVHEQVKRFKRDSPEFKGYNIYGGIAGLSVPKDVCQAAKAQGLFVLQRKGEKLQVQTEGMQAF